MRIWQSIEINNMINASELRELHPIYCYYPKGNTVTFASIKRLLKKTAKVSGVPVAFAFDEIKSENSGVVTVEDCLVVYHPAHRYDYINIVFRIRREGDTAYISKNEYGTSQYLSDTDHRDEKEREAEKQYYSALHLIFSFLKC